MHRKPSHFGSNITPGRSGTASSPFTAFASIGRNGGITGSRTLAERMGQT